jgi:hypothetical protein
VAIGVFVRQASLISGGRAEVAKPESELYERERGQTKKSKIFRLAGELRPISAPGPCFCSLIRSSPGPGGSPGGALWWRLAGARKGEVLGGDSWNNHSTNLSLVSCILELSGLFLVQAFRGNGFCSLQYSRFILFFLFDFCIQICCLVPI